MSNSPDKIGDKATGVKGAVTNPKSVDLHAVAANAITAPKKRANVVSKNEAAGTIKKPV